MELIIELVGRGSRHFDLQKVSGERITIGRAFDNDIILPDPHVCAHHAVLETAANGTVQIRDLASLNGTYAKDRRVVGGGHEVVSGDELIIGKTRIRVYQHGHAVPPAIRLTWIENLAQLAGNPLLAGGVLIVALLMSVFFQYSAAVKGFHVGRDLVTAVGILLAVSIWPAGWSAFARIRKHDARFVAQFSATMIFIVIVALLQKLIHWLGFHTGTSPGLELTGNGLYILLLLLLVWFNYYLSIFQTARRRWIYSVSFTALLAGFAYGVSSFDSDKFEIRPRYNANLYPPALAFYTAQSVDAYLKNAGRIFEESSAMLDDGK